VSSREGREGRLERILNMADGLVGQGANVMILITTNAGPDHLDPAVSRPGRCFANIAFKRFTLEETKARVKGSGLRVKTAMTLAETYNVNRRDQQIRDTKVEAAVGHYL
jgi:ATP-dependent 26S proteasome regulatory subunit